MEFSVSYVKDCPIEEIGEEDEKDFEAESWGDALSMAVRCCPPGFLLKSIFRSDVE